MPKKVTVSLEIPDGKYCDPDDCEQCKALLSLEYGCSCFFDQDVELDTTIDVDAEKMSKIVKGSKCPNLPKEEADEQDG
jgi:hypothetical protein